MAEMKVMEFTEELNLQPARRPVPEPQAGEVLIQVSAAGVRPLQRSFGIPLATMRTVQSDPRRFPDMNSQARLRGWVREQLATAWEMLFSA